jgi:hypothetical protein
MAEHCETIPEPASSAIEVDVPTPGVTAELTVETGG